MENRLNYGRCTVGLLIIISSALLMCNEAMAQITIEQCLELAKSRYPQAGQLQLIDEAAGYDLANVSKTWLPQFTVTGKASYQSDVVEMPFEIPGFTFDLPHDQYSIVGEITQTIWDGGVGKSKRESITEGAEVQKRQVEVSLYSLNEQVEKIYLGILLVDSQLDQNRILQESLERNAVQAQARLDNGMAYQSDLDIIKVSMLNCGQQKAELEITRKAYVGMLERLTGLSLEDNEFIMPPVDESMFGTSEIKRPEIALYDAQIRQNEAKMKQINSNLFPKFSLTLQGGVGRPGLNMLKNEFQPYYVAGIRMQWEIGAIYTRKDDIRHIDADRRKIESDRETFLLNTTITLTEKESAIVKARESLERDKEIIRLRESIRKAGEEQYSGGTLSMTDLMSRIDDEHDAKVSRSIHEIQLVMAIYDYGNSLGY